MVAIRSKGLCPACRAKELPPKGRTAIRAKAKPRGRSLAVFFGAHVAKLSMIRRSATGAYIPCPGVSNICHLYRLLDEFGNVWLLAARRMRDLTPRVEEDGKLKTRLLSWIEENKNYF